MERERKITAPEGCEIEKVGIVDGAAVITFREKERQLPKSWEEFCKTTPTKSGESRIESESKIRVYAGISTRNQYIDRDLLPDRPTAEAVLALCQLIQLRNCYNGDWVPDLDDCRFTIQFKDSHITVSSWSYMYVSPLYFKTQELRDEFLCNFRPLIEKLKPLYGIKEGGEK